MYLKFNARSAFVDGKIGKYNEMRSAENVIVDVIECTSRKKMSRTDKYMMPTTERIRRLVQRAIRTSVCQKKDARASKKNRNAFGLKKKNASVQQQSQNAHCDSA